MRQYLLIKGAGKFFRMEHAQWRKRVRE